MFLVSFLSAQLSSFAINFQGLISSNTTFTLANSPYIVTGQVLIEPGVLLTIEPGVEVVFTEKEFWVASVFPNPVIAKFTIQPPAYKTIAHVTIFNSFGTRVTTLHNTQPGAVEVNMVDLPPGLYIYQIRFDDDHVQTGKLQKL